MYHQTLGNYEHAIDLAHDAIDHGMPPGTPASGVAHGVISSCTNALGNLQQAKVASQDHARLLDRDFPESAYAVAAHMSLARLAVQSKDPIARDEAETALRIARRTGNPSAIASALAVYGWVRIADDRTAALAILDDTIALHRQGAIPHMFGMTLCLTAGIRARTGDLLHATRDLREAVERAHQNSAHLTLYTALLWGNFILVAVDHLNEAAVFDGMASAGLTPEYRAGPDWARIRDAITNARAAYGPERYDAAFQTGAQMPHDQIVQHTLRTLDDLIDELELDDTRRT
jgi:hypothetical protein